MSFFNRRVSLLAALAAAFSITQGGTRAAPHRVDDDRYGANVRHRGSRWQGSPRIRKAIGYAKLSPLIDGVRMRWQDGELVPRRTPQPARVVTPIREARCQRRAEAKREARRLGRKPRR